MTTTDFLRAQDRADQFGRNVAARLSAGTDELPYEVRERLRAARVRALERRKAVAAAQAPVIVGRGGSATLGFGDKVSVWRVLGSVLPLLVLAVGLIVIQHVQTDNRASELAAVDAALLTDDLPPSAYADPGFVQFLKAGRD
jgi:hypothetical protein